MSFWHVQTATSRRSPLPIPVITSDFARHAAESAITVEEAAESGVEAAGAMRLGYPPDANHLRRGPQRNLSFLRER
jgi:hypothetical protein